MHKEWGCFSSWSHEIACVIVLIVLDSVLCWLLGDSLV